MCGKGLLDSYAPFTPAPATTNRKTGAGLLDLGFAHYLGPTSRSELCIEPSLTKLVRRGGIASQSERRPTKEKVDCRLLSHRLTHHPRTILPVSQFFTDYQLQSTGSIVSSSDRVMSQRIKCPSAACCHGRASTSQIRPILRWQRVWNAHPEGGVIALGTGPCNRILFCRMRGSGIGSKRARLQCTGGTLA